MEKIFELMNITNLIVSAVIVTFIVSAVTSVFDEFFKPKTHKKLLVVIVAIVVTVLNNTFVKGDTRLSDYLLTLLLTWSFSVLFYSYAGLWVINKFFEKLKERLSK